MSSSITKTDLSSPLSGRVETRVMPALADTYHVGMPLKYNTASDRYGYTGGGADWELICAEAKTLSGVGTLLCYVSGTRIRSSAIVDNNGASITPTMDQIRSLMLNGGPIID